MSGDRCQMVEGCGLPASNETKTTLTARIDVVEKKIDVLTRKVETGKIQQLCFSPRSKYSNINSRLHSPTAVCFICCINGDSRCSHIKIFTLQLFHIIQASINGRVEKFTIPRSPFSPSIRNSLPFRTSSVDFTSKPQVTKVMILFENLFMFPSVVVLILILVLSNRI